MSPPPLFWLPKMPSRWRGGPRLPLLGFQRLPRCRSSWFASGPSRFDPAFGSVAATPLSAFRSCRFYDFSGLLRDPVRWCRGSSCRPWGSCGFSLSVCSLSWCILRPSKDGGFTDASVQRQCRQHLLAHALPFRVFPQSPAPPASPPLGTLSPLARPPACLTASVKTRCDAAAASPRPQGVAPEPGPLLPAASEDAACSPILSWACSLVGMGSPSRVCSPSEEGDDDTRAPVLSKSVCTRWLRPARVRGLKR